jgi:hypothetical protein
MTSRTIRAMSDRRGRNDLALAAVTIVGLSRLIEPPGVWLVAIFLLGAMLLGALQVLGDETARADGAGLGVPIESLILPAVAAVACVGAIRLVPFGLWLAPALLLVGIVVARTLALEGRLLISHEDPGAEGRTEVLATILVVAFIGFAGVAASVPAGLVQPGTTDGPLPESDLLTLVLGDATIAFLLGYRAAALRLTTFRDALCHLRRGHRDRGRSPAGDGDPAADGPSPPHPGVLPLGCVPCGVAGASTGCPLDLADRAPRRTRDRGRRLEHAPAGVAAGYLSVAPPLAASRRV